MTDVVKMSVSALLEKCERRGYLVKRLYIMNTEPLNGLGPVGVNAVEHLEYWEGLEKRGVLFAGGPCLPSDESSDWDGSGLVIFRAGSQAEAERIAAEDPMHQAGARKYTLSPWLLNHLNAQF